MFAQEMELEKYVQMEEPENLQKTQEYLKIFNRNNVKGNPGFTYNKVGRKQLESHQNSLNIKVRSPKYKSSHFFK